MSTAAPLLPTPVAPTQATPTPPMTIEEFVNRPDSGYPEELVRGKVVRMTPPRPYHGYVCLNVGSILRDHARANDLGYVMGNDSGVITERDPDSLRGADICYYSFARVPKGSLRRDEYLEVPPDLIVEVLSPSDRWPKVLAKVAEYLEVGVPVVVVLDTAERSLYLYTPDRPVRILGETDEFALPEVLGDLRVVVGRFFD